MNDSDIVKRIMDLKKISVQLKQTADQSKGTDTNNLRGILQISKTMSAARKSVSSPSQFSLRSPSFSLKDDNKLNKKLAFGDSPNNVDQYENSQNHNKQQQTNKQISNLKAKNSQLQNQILTLQEELKKLQQIQKMEIDEEWKDGLPYFVQHYKQMKVFYTKLNILEKDYQKIDFSKQQVHLSMDKITITSSSNSPSKNNRTVNLLLSELREVEYPTSSRLYTTNILTKIKEQEQQYYLIVYRFLYHNKKKDSQMKSDKEQITETLFVKFSNEQEYNQFDMGVFINYKIIEDLKLEGKDEEEKKEEFKKKMNLNRPQQLKKGFKEKLEQYRNKSKEKQKQQQNNKNVSPTHQIQNKEKNHNEQQEQLDSQTDRIYIKKVQSIDEMFKQKQERSATSKFFIPEDLKRQEQKKQQEEEEKKRIKEKEQKDQEARFNIQNFLQKKKEEEERLKIRQEEIEIIKRNEAALILDNAKQNLIKSYSMIKYTKGAINPHNKEVYLDAMGKQLRWRDPNEIKKYKFVKIKEIKQIKHGEVGQGIVSHLPKAQSEDKKQRYVLIVTSNKQRKILQFGTDSINQMREFCKNLLIVWEKQIKQD